MNKCDVPKCKNEVEITYYAHGVCKDCFRKHCDEKNKFDLKDIFKILPAKKSSLCSDKSLPEPHQQELLLSKAS
jgi:hypothetical protein